jgi:hypothetical protein
MLEVSASLVQDIPGYSAMLLKTLHFRSSSGTELNQFSNFSSCQLPEWQHPTKIDNSMFSSCQLPELQAE